MMSNMKTPSRAWRGVLDFMGEATEAVVERCHGDPAMEAEGCRFLGRLWASMRLFLVEQDPERPNFVPVMTSARKFFADNPDTLYHRSPLRGDLAYRVTGQRGSCAYLSFCVYAAGPEGARIVSDLSDKALVTDAEGRFEIVLSAERDEAAANWMALEEGVRSLVVRQYTMDREEEIPATYDITCLRADGQGARELSAEPFLALRETLRRAVNATLKAGDAWSREANVISFSSDAAGVVDLFPTPDNQYTGGWFDLKEEEALVLTLSPPECRYWNVHLMSRWLESFEISGGPVCLNKAQVELDAEGQARFVIAHEDPGRSPFNWLDTGGRHHGFFAFRWLQAERSPDSPKCEVVKLEDLRR